MKAVAVPRALAAFCSTTLSALFFAAGPASRSLCTLYIQYGVHTVYPTSPQVLEARPATSPTLPELPSRPPKSLFGSPPTFLSRENSTAVLLERPTQLLTPLSRGSTGHGPFVQPWEPAAAALSTSSFSSFVVSKLAADPVLQLSQLSRPARWAQRPGRA